MVYGYYASAIARTYFPSGNEFASLMLALSVFGAGFPDAAARRHRARRVYRSSRPPQGPDPHAGADGDGHGAASPSFPAMRRSACWRRSSCCWGACCRASRRASNWAACRSICREIATQGNKGFYCSWQSASQQVAVVFAALLGVVLNQWCSADHDDAVGMAHAVHHRLPDRAVPVHDPPFAAGNRRVPRAQAPPERSARSCARWSSNWRIVLAGMGMVVMTTVSFY